MKKNTNIVNSGKLEIKVSSPDLNRLTINGSGDISGKAFNCRKMAISGAV